MVYLIPFERRLLDGIVCVVGVPPPFGTPLLYCRYRDAYVDLNPQVASVSLACWTAMRALAAIVQAKDIRSEDGKLACMTVSFLLLVACDV